MADGTEEGEAEWGIMFGGVLKSVIAGTAAVAAVAFLPQGLQLISDGFESLAGNASTGAAVTVSNAMETGAQWLSSHYVDTINWVGQYLGSPIDPKTLVSAAGVTLPVGQTAEETVFTNWDAFKEFADVSTQNAGNAISGLWNYSKANPLTIGAPLVGAGYLGSKLVQVDSEKLRPSIGRYTAAYNARNGAGRSASAVPARAS